MPDGRDLSFLTPCCRILRCNKNFNFLQWPRFENVVGPVHRKNEFAVSYSRSKRQKAGRTKVFDKRQVWIMNEIKELLEETGEC